VGTGTERGEEDLARARVNRLRAPSSYLFVALVATCLLAGCFSKAIHESDFIGRYEATLPGSGTETLELVEGGKCKQVVRLCNGTVYEAVGTWELWSHHGSPHLLFKGIRATVTGFKELNPNITDAPVGGVGKSVTPSWTGKPMINFTEDTYYRKVN
jgi:hypothetical protein